MRMPRDAHLLLWVNRAGVWQGPRTMSHSACGHSLHIQREQAKKKLDGL
jgi:hypothetical protein